MLKTQQNAPKKGTKYYAVAHGRQTGVFDNWFTTPTGKEGAHAATDGFPNSRPMSFATRADAEQFLRKPWKRDASAPERLNQLGLEPQKGDDDISNTEPPPPPPQLVAKRERSKSPEPE